MRRWLLQEWSTFKRTGGDLQWKKALSAQFPQYGSLEGILIQVKAGSPFLPPLFTLLVKSTLLIVAGGAKNAEALVTNCIFIFLN